MCSMGDCVHMHTYIYIITVITYIYIITVITYQLIHPFTV
jgi:hypothetical protein